MTIDFHGPGILQKMWEDFEEHVLMHHTPEDRKELKKVFYSGVYMYQKLLELLDESEKMFPGLITVTRRGIRSDLQNYYINELPGGKKKND